MRKSRCSQGDAPRIAHKYSLFWSAAPNRRPDKGRFMRYAIGQGRMAVPVCILTLQRNNDDDFDRKRSRKRRGKTDRGGFWFERTCPPDNTRDGLFRHEAGKNTRDRKHAVHWQDGNGTSGYAVRPTHRAAFAVDFNGWRADNRRVRCISVGLSCLFPVEGMEKRQREKAGRCLVCKAAR